MGIGFMKIGFMEDWVHGFMDIYEDHGHLLKIPVYKKPHINKISPANPCDRRCC
jgi:hypothetical protein